MRTRALIEVGRAGVGIRRSRRCAAHFDDRPLGHA